MVRRTAMIVAVWGGLLTMPGLVAARAADGLAEIEGRLGSASVAERLAASAELARRGEISLRDIEDRLSEPGLDAEVRVRLTEAARERFMASPRAAMGITRSDDVSRGVFVASVRGDFPAAEVLKADDRIETIEGHRLDSFEAFRMRVISRDPGDVVRVGIVRGGQPMTVRVTLGEYGAGGGMQWQMLDERTLGEAWAVRLGDVVPPPAPLVVRGVGRAGSDDVGVSTAPVALPDGTWEAFSVTAGGEPTPGVMREGAVAMGGGARGLAGRNAWRVNRGEVQVQVLGPNGVVGGIGGNVVVPNIGGDARQRLLAQIRSSQMMVSNLRQTMQMLQMMAPNGVGRPQDLARLQEQNRVLIQQQIDAEEARIARLQAQVRALDKAQPGR